MKSRIVNTILLLGLIVSVKAQDKAKTKEKEVVPEKKPFTVVAEFKGQQVTGVTVAGFGRIFANFPRWRASVENSVVEVKPNGTSVAYPDARWNSWKPDMPVEDSVFVAVQSVQEADGKLYVLDTRNPLWKGVVNSPRIFVFDLRTNKLADILVLSEYSYKPNSYINDLCIDTKHNVIYMTDSNEPGLVLYDLKKRTCNRVLTDHVSTTGEVDHLTIDGKKWGSKPVHSDGIAYDEMNDRLYYHALTGYTLYSVSASAMRNGTDDDVVGSVRKVATTPAPDGMVFDMRGNIYMADLEKHAIVYVTRKGEQRTLVEDVKVGWADSFSIHGGYLYFTNSRIHEAGSGAEELSYQIYKIPLEYMYRTR
ncbi:Major royal jelly protein [Filimonas lacunae]|uniref:Major royal jelly protein n=1 Tax=Filimonas lacunae TaxID=477680 RepID=A0A173MI41_9BACT|nr:L-dopachrome tautomerase-related protein [Filimonas lacunae]BAV07284.1 hypothetical protein FLA_3307 [Filimonas lacunae]SIS92016.1 Major royal jelly protein [Filimonas lacunae]